jgi:hypothetical protein
MWGESRERREVVREGSKGKEKKGKVGRRNG